MARKIIQLYRGTTAQNDAFTGAAGEVTVDTDTNELRVHDGSTAGGFAVAKKSAIPTVNNATLTIQKNGTTVNTFTANASSNVTANITVPTKISDLTNDSNFANTDLSNLTSTGKNFGNWSTNISNCITEIPQDINLTLSSGTLTLKAGSKVYNAYGTLGTTTTIASDLTKTYTYNGTYMVNLDSGGNLYLARIEGCLSGPIANRPSSLTVSSGLYFATDENKMYFTGNYGTDWYTGAKVTLPFAIVTVSGGAITSIDQVFNGFGYIGSTLFALPGVKVLAPYGRNADGTLKTYAYEFQSVKTRTETSTQNSLLAINCVNGSLGVSAATGNYAYAYNEKDNLIYLQGVVSDRRCVIGSFTETSGVISNFNIKTPFHAVDYSDFNSILTTGITKAANGFVKLCNGLIIQWGEIPAESASTSGSVTLPTPFTTTNYTVCINSNGGENGYIARATTRTTTSFNYVRDVWASTYNPTITKSWIAIGY